MAYTDPIDAVMQLYNSLSAGNFPNSVLPTIYLDEAPQLADANTPIRVPYVMIFDSGADPTWNPGLSKAQFDGGFTLQYYYRSLPECTTAMNAVMWNGQDPRLKAGLALAELDLEAPYKGGPIALTPGRVVRHKAPFLDYQNYFVYYIEHRWGIRYFLDKNPTY